MKKKMLMLGVATGLVLSTIAAADPAGAQDARYETCAAYGTLTATGGQSAVAAAQQLQALGDPNPVGIEAALGVIIDAEDGAGTAPDAGAIQAAFDSLEGYYGPVCNGIDVCPLVRQATATIDAASANAARLVRGITASAPPGIDAGLAVISGVVTPEESGFYTTIAEAQAAVATYFPCTLAFTAGSSTLPLAVTGGALLASGSGCLVLRRHLTRSTARS